MDWSFALDKLRLPQFRHVFGFYDERLARPHDFHGRWSMNLAEIMKQDYKIAHGISAILAMPLFRWMLPIHEMRDDGIARDLEGFRQHGIS